MSQQCLPDIVYARWYKKDNVFRVARVSEGCPIALYPTPNKDVFATEAESSIETLARKEIKDKIWLRLLEGESRESILARFEEHAGYHVSRSRKSKYDPFKLLELPTFHIAEDRQETPKTN